MYSDVLSRGPRVWSLSALLFDITGLVQMCAFIVFSLFPPAGQGQRVVLGEYEGAAAGSRAAGSVFPGVQGRSLAGQGQEAAPRPGGEGERPGGGAGRTGWHHPDAGAGTDVVFKISVVKYITFFQ